MGSPPLGLGAGLSVGVRSKTNMVGVRKGTAPIQSGCPYVFVPGSGDGFFFLRRRRGRVNFRNWDDKLKRRLTFSAIIGATFWLPATN